MSRLGMPGAAPGARRGRCLGDQVTTYADRAMDPVTLREWDRHLVTCGCCRAAVDEERRVLASLRSTSASMVPTELRSMLIAMAQSSPGPTHDFGGVPPVPVAPVRVVDRGAPALHRSVRRATVFAGLAAGATAVAACSLVLTGGSLTSPNPEAPAVQRARPAAPGFATAAFTVPNLGGGSAATSTTPSMGVPAGRSAQSTP
jgi:hypothetical protein